MQSFISKLHGYLKTLLCECALPNPSPERMVKSLRPGTWARANHILYHGRKVLGLMFEADLGLVFEADLVLQQTESLNADETDPPRLNTLPLR